MTYTNKKGQGFDTFKLLIAAVVAMVILSIVTGVFGKVWAMITGISCVSDPIGEIVSTVQNAQSGTTTSSQMLCLKSSGDSFSKIAVNNKLSGGAEIQDMACSTDTNDNTICAGSSPSITITGSGDNQEIKAIKAGGAQFKVRVCCGAACPGGTGWGNNKCDITVINPNS